MQTVPLKIGAKGAREAVRVPLNKAENVEEMQKLSRGNIAVVVRCFNRGWAIENQERSGARDAFKENKTEAEIATLVSGYDPTKVVPRTGGSRKPKEVKLVKGKKTYTPEELRELLAASGIKADLIVAE